MIKLSKPSKMPCYSWSLEALATCPGAMHKGLLVDACAGCYATGGFYKMPSVIALRKHNKEDWKRSTWTSEFIALLDSERYFRWFDSGDMYCLPLANKILEVCKATPWVNHWIPTRMQKFEKFTGVLTELNNLSNACLRLSSDSISGKVPFYYADLNHSTIVSNSEQLAVDQVLCNSPEQGGKCLECRVCWSKDIATVAYKAHGSKMLKLVKSKTIE